MLPPGVRIARMTRPTLPRLIDLAAQLREDAEGEVAELRRRDRRIGRELDGVRSRRARVSAWLDRVRPPSAAGAGRRAVRTERALRLGLAALGAALGATTGATLFFYDGTHPVNAVRVVAVFVGLQVALIVATALLALPEAWRERVPGLAAVQDVLALFSPGRFEGLLGRLLPAERREGLDRALGRLRAQGRLYTDVRRWALLLGSQTFAVAFNVGALAACLFLVSFTDLAFGWSTTLEVDARSAKRVTDALALPWAALVPDAVPTLALIETTQYFRGGTHAADPAATAPWWRFLFACMLVYGLLPRSVFYALARWRLSANVARCFDRLPGLAALRDRLDSRLVETAAEETEAGGPEPGFAAAPVSSLALGTPCRVVQWSGAAAGAGDLGAALGVRVTELFEAGGGRAALDAEVVRGVASGIGNEAVLVVVKAWEPPLLEVVDFLVDLRRAVGRDRSLAVAPVGLDTGGALVAADPGDLRQWRHRLESIGDPHLALHQPSGGRP